MKTLKPLRPDIFFKPLRRIGLANTVPPILAWPARPKRKKPRKRLRAVNTHIKINTRRSER